MDITVAKGICLVIFFVIPVAFGVLPVCLVAKCKFKLTRSAKGKGILCYLNCFAGGVFLGTSLLGLMTEGKEQLQEYMESVELVEYPFFEVGIGVGFFLVALIEKLSYRVQARSGNAIHNHDHGNGAANHRHHHKDKDHHHHEDHHSYQQHDHQSSRETVQAEDLVLKVMVDDDVALDGKSYLEQDSKVKRLNGGVGDHAGQGISGRYTKREPLDTETSLIERTALSSAANNSDGRVRNNNHYNEVYKQQSATADSTKLRAESASSHAPVGVSSEKDQMNEEEEDSEEGGVDVSTVRASLLLLALSFHTIFDGLAVGLQTRTSALWSVLAAVVIHKIIVSLCLGIELSTAMPNKPLRATLSMLVYAIMAPVGVGIGMGITSGEVDKLAELLTGGILQAIATGAFLYVTSVEILGHAMATEDGSVLKVFTAVSGFATMALVKVWD